MNKECKCSNVVYFDYSYNDLIDIVIKYSDEILDLIPSSPYRKIWELSLSKKVLESYKNYYNNNYYNKNYINEYNEILIKKYNQLHYTLTKNNKSLEIIPILDNYISKENIIDENIKEELIEKSKMFLLKDSEIRKQSVSLDDYWTRSLDMLKNTYEGKDIINYICVELFDKINYGTDLIDFLPSEEDFCANLNNNADPLDDKCNSEEEREFAKNAIDINIDHLKQQIETVDNFLSTI